MKIVDYLNPGSEHWEVDELGWPNGSNEKAPDDVLVGEKVRFEKYGGILVAKVDTGRFGTPDLVQAAPSWDGLPFRIVGTDVRDNVTLQSFRLIHDEDTGSSEWHILNIGPDGQNGGIVCTYSESREYILASGDEVRNGVVSGSIMGLAAGGHNGTWHAPD